MTITKPHECDIDNIIEIIQESNIRNLQSPYNNGFLIYDIKDLYIRRIQKLKFNYVVKDDNEDVIGCLLCIAKDERSEYFGEDILPLPEYLDNVENYVWLSQIAIRHKYQGQGIGTQLLKHAYDDILQQGQSVVIGALSLFPDFNHWSYRLVKMMNWDIKATIMADCLYAQNNKRIWGVFSNK